LKTHYFDYVDFNNKTLQSSSFLEQRMLNYVFGISDEALDEAANYKKNIDVFCKLTKAVPNEVKRILLVDLWEQMRDLGFENVANYISETYLMDIAVALNDQELISGLMLLINTAIGEKAPDFSFKIEKDKTITTKKLSELNGAKNYIVVFWSSTCSHCLDEIPQLHKYIKAKDKGLVKVIAIGLEDEPKKWNELTKIYSEFVHVYGKGKWDNEIGDAYGVTSTPTYFILDKDKKIISKPENIESLKMFFEEEK
jgi:thiol-disulfide isomerase/thioredoxin